MSDLIPAIEDALRALSAGESVQPVRTVVPVAPHAGFLGSMPAFAGGHLGAKLVTFYPKNEGLPTHHALIVLFDPTTGAPEAVMDGRLITEMRTAAASAVATKHLARKEASVLAILGSGVQAESHLEAMHLVRKFTEVRVWSPRNARVFAKNHGVRATATAEEAVRGADVIVVATSSTVPVLEGAWVAPGAHVNAVGATRPTWRELDDELLRRAKLYVDSREASARESGEVIQAGAIFAEVGELVAGKRPGRESHDEVTLFKSVGVAVEDVASAGLVLRNSDRAPGSRTT
jgi:ornithine cyclodeaminase/alanine dehydrogenase-like protein (mu-crystallin family)